MEILNNNELENIYGGGLMFKVVMGIITAGAFVVGVLNGYLNSLRTRRKWKILN